MPGHPTQVPPRLRSTGSSAETRPPLDAARSRPLRVLLTVNGSRLLAMTIGPADADREPGSRASGERAAASLLTVSSRSVGWQTKGLVDCNARAVGMLNRPRAVEGRDC